MKSISEYSETISRAIEDLHLPSETYPTLYEPVEYALAAGGKRLRPVLVMMSCEGFGGNDTSSVRPALGMEMFHNFTLLHDDVMDRSDLRRGRPTVHVRWDETTAILSGDAMLTLATDLVAEVDDNILRRVITLFDRMALDVYEGQALDMDFEKRHFVALDDYIRMISLKTGALLAACCELGARIAGASENDCKEMYSYGMSLGLAFQICDDYLDLYGDAETFGKPIGGDVLNNKKTFLSIGALIHTEGDAKKAIEEAMMMPSCAGKIERMRDLYTAAGMPDICHSAITRFASEAKGHVDSTAMSDEAKLCFINLVDKLTGRRR